MTTYSDDFVIPATPMDLLISLIDAQLSQIGVQSDGPTRWETVTILDAIKGLPREHFVRRSLAKCRLGHDVSRIPVPDCAFGSTSEQQMSVVELRTKLRQASRR